MQLFAPGKDEWIIIPDGNLYLFPFESVTDETTGKLLLETTTISYAFSSRFLHGKFQPRIDMAVQGTGLCAFRKTGSRLSTAWF